MKRITRSQSAAAISVAHALSQVDPRIFELPSRNWACCKMWDSKSLLIGEIIMPMGPETPRVRKHVHVNTVTGVCTSYIMDRKISDRSVLTKSDIEHCVEELHMMHACVGGPQASKFQGYVPPNARIDSTGKWRHNSCKLVASWTGMACITCEELQYDWNNLPSTSEQQKKSANLRILRKKKNWYKKKNKLAKKVQMKQKRILDISEKPEENGENIKMDIKKENIKMEKA